MARKITISFKETSKDLELYQIIMNMEDKSCELKQILRKSLVQEIIPQRSKRVKKEDIEDVNVLDF